MTPEIRGELIELRAKVAAESKSHLAPIFADLEDGEDEYEFTTRFDYSDLATDIHSATQECSASWNSIFAGIAPRLLHETTESQMSSAVTSVLRTLGNEIALGEDDVFQVHGLNIESTEAFRDILVQLMALRLIERGTAKRTVSDRQKYWKLTDVGEDRMMQLRARRKSVKVDATGNITVPQDLEDAALQG